MADVHEILDYLNEAITDNDLDRHLQLGHKVLQTDLSSEDARWTVTLERTSDSEQFDATCGRWAARIAAKYPPGPAPGRRRRSACS